jgi:hypothetical protein
MMHYLHEVIQYLHAKKLFDSYLAEMYLKTSKWCSDPDINLKSKNFCKKILKKVFVTLSEETIY